METSVKEVQAPVSGSSIEDREKSADDAVHVRRHSTRRRGLEKHENNSEVTATSCVSRAKNGLKVGDVVSLKQLFWTFLQVCFLVDLTSLARIVSFACVFILRLI
jgi:hypothetical protein